MRFTRDGEKWSPTDFPSENVRMINVLVTLDGQGIHVAYVEQGWTLADIWRDMLACYVIRYFKLCMGDKIVRPRAERAYDFKDMYGTTLVTV